MFVADMTAVEAFISENPEVKAGIQRQMDIVQRVADNFGWPWEVALKAMGQWNRQAIEAFAIGNMVQRETLN